jgi:hypothetical protein
MDEELAHRFSFHTVSARAPEHEALRHIIRAADEVDQALPDGRDKSLALTALEESLLWVTHHSLDRARDRGEIDSQGRWVAGADEPPR